MVRAYHYRPYGAYKIRNSDKIYVFPEVVSYITDQAFPFFQRATLKNWEEPGDEAIAIAFAYSIEGKGHTYTYVISV